MDATTKTTIDLTKTLAKAGFRIPAIELHTPDGRCWNIATVPAGRGRHLDGHWGPRPGSLGGFRLFEIDRDTDAPSEHDAIDGDTLEMLGEYQNFLERTRLDKLRPEQHLRLSVAGGYQRILEHIAVHRYYMGLEQKRDITEDEAVTDWFDNVYLPIVNAVRDEDMLKDFPNRTAGDLYLWVVDHQHYLREHMRQEGRPDYDVDAAEAAAEQPAEGTQEQQ